MAKKAKGRSKGAGTLVLRGRTWYARWTVDGKTYTRTTEQGDKREAEKRLKELTEPFRLNGELATIKALTDKAGGIEQDIEDWKDGQTALTMLAAWKVFVASPKGKTPRGRVIMPGARTLADYEGRWNAFVTWLEKNYPTEKDELGIHKPRELRAVTKEQAQRYINEIGATRSANTRNKTLTFLRLVFKVLAKDARVKQNPFDGLDAAPMAVTKKRPLTLDELAAVSEQLRGSGEMETLFSFGFYIGARLGDCVSMRWDMIDMRARKIRYTPSKTKKTSEEIVVGVAPALYSLLEATPKTARRGHVMPELAELYKTRSGVAALCKRVQKVFQGAGIETGLEVAGYSRQVAKVGFHSLRHSHITALLEGGAPMESVRKRVGHASIDMTAHYFKDSGEATERAVRALPAFGHVNTLPEVTDATGAKLGTVLAMLDGLNDQELSEVIKQAGSIISGRA